MDDTHISSFLFLIIFTATSR